MVGTSGQVPHAVRGSLAGHARVRIGRLADRVRHLDVDGGVGLDLGHGEIERGESPMRLADLRRKLHAAEVTVLRVRHRDGHVAPHGMGHHSFDALDQVRRVEERRCLEAAWQGERDRASLDRALTGERRLHDAVRSRPELELPLGERDRRRRCGLAGHVPGVLSAEQEDLPVFAPNVRGPAARRFERPRPHEIVAQRCRLEVHDPCHRAHVELRPRLARDRALSDLEHRPAALDLDRFEVVRAQRLRDGFERRSSVLGLDRHRGDQQNRRQQKGQLVHS